MYLMVIGRETARLYDVIIKRLVLSGVDKTPLERFFFPYFFCFRRKEVAMAVESRVTQEEIKKEPEKPVDREKVFWEIFRLLN